MISNQLRLWAVINAKKYVYMSMCVLVCLCISMCIFAALWVYDAQWQVVEKNLGGADVTIDFPYLFKIRIQKKNE